MMSTFTLKARVYYEDTDAGGIVYHANYLKFTERARTEWLRALGVSQEEMLKSGSGFVITELKAKYLRSARLDDVLTISCLPVRLRRLSLNFAQEIRNAQDELLFVLECTVAHIDFKLNKPTAIPAPLYALIQAAMQGEA